MENEDWPEGGIFDETEDEDMFGDEELEEDSGPLTTRAQEEMVSALPGTPAPAPARQLVAFFGADGNPLVAYSINGQLQEQPRMPTQQELTLLQERGRLVQGGIQNEPSLGAAPAVASGSFLTRNATLLGGLAAVAVGAGVYFYQKRKRQEEEATENYEVLSGDLAEAGEPVSMED